MLILNISILLLFAIGYLYSIKNTNEIIQDIDRKEHKLFILYPLAEVILTKTGLGKYLNRKGQITNSIKALYVTNKPEILQKLYWCSRISLIIAILILFDLLSLLGQLQSTGNSIIQDGKYVTRPDYGEGSAEVKLKVAIGRAGKTAGTDKESIKEAEAYSQNLTIKVKERAYSEEELSQIFEEAIQYLNLYVLGDNSSADLVYDDLNFIKAIPGTSIMVEWQPENYNLIQLDGTVHNEQIEEDGLITFVTATLTYHNQQVEHSMSFHIMPKKYSEEEKLLKKLEKEVTVSDEKSKEDSRMELPEEIENYRLKWSREDENTGITVLILGALMALLAWIIGDKELNNQMTKRKEQMLLDYPEIINKFTLLVNAGMTVKQAWNKIAEDYGFKILQKESEKRFAYEEMLTTSHELRLGLPESIAYEQYGRRTGLIPYIKFSSLISQNLKKGNRGFTELLMKEAIEAFEDRKETAKRLGEEAGTKLLMPMMIMLIIVFLIILVPAFWSFRV